MDTGTVIVLTTVTLYLVWLITFLLVVERWLRRLVEWVFDVTIERNFDRPVGKVELVDALFVFSWKVAQPANLVTRFTIGLLRFLFWMAAVIMPVLVGIAIYLAVSRSI
jgi:hypothetical protein